MFIKFDTEGVGLADNSGGWSPWGIETERVMKTHGRRRISRMLSRPFWRS
jgi:hypothetical protein